MPFVFKIHGKFVHYSVFSTIEKREKYLSEEVQNRNLEALPSNSHKGFTLDPLYSA
jgi:hypothetical protein